MLKYSEEIAALKDVCQSAGNSWNAINPESAARMRLQNRFLTGLDIARYTADISLEDARLEAQALDPTIMIAVRT